jgi:hypothetical protein
VEIARGRMERGSVEMRGHFLRESSKWLKDLGLHEVQRGMQGTERQGESGRHFTCHVREFGFCVKATGSCFMCATSDLNRFTRVKRCREEKWSK